MPKRSDIEAQIEALKQELAGADDDDDFEIEIFKDGKGARVPFRHGKSWLERELGLSFDSPASAAPGGDEGGDEGPASGQPATRSARRTGPSEPRADTSGPRSYFSTGKR